MDFIPGEGSAGVVIYDDKFSYSHHETCKLCNAFDLVAFINSVRTMIKNHISRAAEFAMTLDKVKLQDLEEKIKKGSADDF